ncbi:MAG: DUF3846 domain-containing protein [Oscillospiraceae bacterium]|nr:DUF3846 domain-containing protein [Oscillospiraceae bacterium]
MTEKLDETTDAKIKVLVVEPLKEPYVREISGLDDMQAVVGGHIEAAYPFPDDNVAVVCNESGKIMGLPANRPIMDESGLIPKDIIQGTFFVAGIGEDDFISLSAEQIQRYTDYYKEHTVIDAVKTEEVPTKEPPAEKADVSDATDKPKRYIRFIDSHYNTLFHIPDGGNLMVKHFDGREKLYPCHYVDDYHFFAGKSSVFHICEFAEAMQRCGDVYRPEIPQKGDILDTYEIFQLDLSDKKASAYSFCPYEMAKGKIRPAHYQRMYAGVLAPKTTLEELFQRHNSDSRPFARRMRSLSVSDIVVLNRGGERQAFYVDSFGFKECKEFLKPPRRTRSPKKKPGQAR